MPLGIPAHKKGLAIDNNSLTQPSGVRCAALSRGPHPAAPVGNP